MSFRYSMIILSLILSIPCVAQEADSTTEIPNFEPNKTLREQVLAFGPDPQSAERAATIKAWNIARNGVYKVKNIGLGSVDGEDFCMLSIEHNVYQPSDTNRVDESVVGYGSTPKDSLANARSKALRRIRENPRSRPNLRSSTLPFRTEAFLPMPKEDERDFTETSIRFWGRNGDFRCYLKFEYLEMK